MRAALCDRLGDGVDHLNIIDMPAHDPGPGELRIRLRAAAVNFPDLLMVQGKYQFKPPMPFVPGVEGAGDVIAVGEGVENIRPGDKMVVRATYGTFAEEICVSASTCRPMPAGLSYEEAAAYPVIYLTAWVSLVSRGELKPGETLLVHGAAGGVGLATVELGKLLGATVIATAGSPEKRAVVAAKGADHVLDSHAPFKDAVKELTGGKGADMIFDPVGGNVFDESLRCIAFDGKLLIIGFASGRIPTVAANIPLLKCCSLIGVRAGEYGRMFPDRSREILRSIDTLAAEGKIRPHIHAAYPLEQIGEAMRQLESREVIGKVVVTM